MKTRNMITVSFAVAVLFLFSCTPQEKQNDNSAMIEKNKMAAQKIFDTFSTGNSDSLGIYMKDNYVEHQGVPEIKTTGIQGFKDITTYYRTAFPDFKVTTMSMVAEGDLVAVMYNTKATNSGPIGAMPATNKPVDFSGVDIFKFADGKVVEHWGYFEELKMMSQLGLMPEMNPAENANPAKK